MLKGDTMKDTIQPKDLHDLSNGLLSIEESADILIRATRAWGIYTQGQLNAFLWLIDDEEECFVPHIFIKSGPWEKIYANALCTCLNTYREEKEFLYTQLFNYPPIITQILTQQGYETLSNAMRYKEGALNESIPSPTLTDLTITTDPAKIDMKGVNDIYDAVGWGARTNELWEKILKNSSFMVQVSLKDKVVGFARMTDNGQYGMVYDVCVNPQYQGKHIGTILMKETVSYIQSKKLKFAGLVVVPENLSAKNFYRKFNFESTDPILEFYFYNENHSNENSLDSSKEKNNPNTISKSTAFNLKIIEKSNCCR